MKTLFNTKMIIEMYYELFTVYIVPDTVDTHFINTVRMEDTDHEVEFRKIVYEVCKK